MNTVIIPLSLSQALVNPVLATMGGSRAGSAPGFILRDLINLRLVFYDEGENVELVATSAIFGGKATANLSADVLFFSGGPFLPVEVEGVTGYEAIVDFNTVQAIAAFTGNTKSIQITCDVQLDADDLSERRTLQFTSTLRRDVITGEEPPPVEGQPLLPAVLTPLTLLGSGAGPNAQYVQRTAAEVLAFLGLAGMGNKVLTSVDGAEETSLLNVLVGGVTGVDALSWRKVVDSGLPAPINGEWTLYASTSATVAGVTQRPANYAGGTNELVWYKTA